MKNDPDGWPVVWRPANDPAQLIGGGRASEPSYCEPSQLTDIEPDNPDSNPVIVVNQTQPNWTDNWTVNDLTQIDGENWRRWMTSDGRPRRRLLLWTWRTMTDLVLAQKLLRPVDPIYWWTIIGGPVDPNDSWTVDDRTDQTQTVTNDPMTANENDQPMTDGQTESRTARSPDWRQTMTDPDRRRQAGNDDRPRQWPLKDEPVERRTDPMTQL